GCSPRRAGGRRGPAGRGGGGAARPRTRTRPPSAPFSRRRRPGRARAAARRRPRARRPGGAPRRWRRRWGGRPSPRGPRRGGGTPPSPSPPPPPWPAAPPGRRCIPRLLSPAGRPAGAPSTRSSARVPSFDRVVGVHRPRRGRLSRGDGACIFPAPARPQDKRTPRARQTRATLHQPRETKPAPGSLWHQHLPEEVDSRLERAEALARESLIETHAELASDLVGILAPRMPFDEAIDRYLESMGLEGEDAEAVGSRAVAMLDEREISEDLAREGTRGWGFDWRYATPLGALRFIQRQRKRSAQENLWLELAGERGGG